MSGSFSEKSIEKESVEAVFASIGWFSEKSIGKESVAVFAICIQSQTIPEGVIK